MGVLRKYDPKEVTISWGGLSLNEGIVDGSFIVVSRNEANSSLNMGGDGDGTMVIENNRSGIFTLTIRAGSSTNKKLQQVLAEDEADSANKKIDLFRVKDFSGESQASGAETFLNGPPELEYATEEGENVWSFECPNLRIEPGASNRAAPDTAGQFGGNI